MTSTMLSYRRTVHNLFITPLHRRYNTVASDEVIIVSSTKAQGIVLTAITRLYCAPHCLRQ